MGTSLSLSVWKVHCEWRQEVETQDRPASHGRACLHIADGPFPGVCVLAFNRGKDSEPSTLDSQSSTTLFLSSEEPGPTTAAPPSPSSSCEPQAFSPGPRACPRCCTPLPSVPAPPASALRRTPPPRATNRLLAPRSGPAPRRLAAQLPLGHPSRRPRGGARSTGAPRPAPGRRGQRGGPRGPGRLPAALRAARRRHCELGSERWGHPCGVTDNEWPPGRHSEGPHQTGLLPGVSASAPARGP
nr:uncharacterized protein LOC116147827 [Camelus dromedarius]